MSIKRAIAIGLIVVLATLASSAADAAMMFSSTLTGDQEVPQPTTSPYSGTAAFTLFEGPLGPWLHFDMLFDPVFNFGLAESPGTTVVSGLHIHQAPRGANGPIVFGLIGLDNDLNDDTIYSLLPDGSTRVTGQWEATEGNATTFAALASFFTGAAPGADVPFYVNLHTPAFPGGEIRGQIVVASIPLPATLPLLAGGLLLLVWRRWGHGLQD